MQPEKSAMVRACAAARAPSEWNRQRNEGISPKLEQWLTASEAASYLKVKTRTLLLWVRQGQVKAFALSGTKRHVWRFRCSDLDQALKPSLVLPSTVPSVLGKGKV